MGLFGGSKGTSTKTEVKPSKEVENILKRVTEQVQNQEPQDFIAHQYADLSPEAYGVLSNVEKSGDLTKLSGIMSPRLKEGVEQIAQSNNDLRSELNAPTDVNSILKQSDVFKQGLQKTATQQGLAGTSNFLKGSAAARRATKTQGAAIEAQASNSPGATNLAINQNLNAAGNRIAGAGIRGNVGTTNMNIGVQGAQLGNQANQNAVMASLTRQQNANAQLQNEWQNKNAEAQWPFQQVQNKANMLNEISPLAGSTTTGTQSGISKGQKLFGQALQLGGTVAGAYFSGGPTTQEKNAWNSYNTNGGQAGVAGPMPQGSEYGNLSQAPQQQQPSAWGRIQRGYNSMYGFNPNGGW